MGGYYSVDANLRQPDGVQRVWWCTHFMHSCLVLRPWGRGGSIGIRPKTTRYGEFNVAPAVSFHRKGSQLVSIARSGELPREREGRTTGSQTDTDFGLFGLAPTQSELEYYVQNTPGETFQDALCVWWASSPTPLPLPENRGHTGVKRLFLDIPKQSIGNKMLFVTGVGKN